METLSVNHILGIKDLTKADIELIFSTADEFKDVINRPIKKVPTLRDITIANLFFENSTRTKLSFELAEKRLSADIINFSSSSSQFDIGSFAIGYNLFENVSGLGPSVKAYHELNSNNGQVDIVGVPLIWSASAGGVAIDGGD